MTIKLLLSNLTNCENIQNTNIGNTLVQGHITHNSHHKRYEITNNHYPI